MSKATDKDSVLVNRLKEIKRWEGITQAEMARALNLKPQTISNYFCGREPSCGVLAAICRRFQVSADYLLGLSDVPKAQTDKELAAENQYLRERLQEIQRIITETRGI